MLDSFDPVFIGHVEANPKTAGGISLAQYIKYRQSPRAASYRAQADQFSKIRDNILRAQGQVDLRSDEDAMLFIHGLYGPRGAAFLAAKIEVTKNAAGSPVETNIQNLAVLTTTLEKDGRVEYRVRPADPAQARKQTEELAGIFRQSANEQSRLAATPPFLRKQRGKTKCEIVRGKRPRFAESQQFQENGQTQIHHHF